MQKELARSLRKIAEEGRDLFYKGELSQIPHDSFEYYHLLVEALKLTFRDRNQVLTDPVFYDIPLDRLLSKKYAAELAKAIRLDRSEPVASSSMGSDTTYAAVVDQRSAGRRRRNRLVIT